jgi:ubiquinone/menaquinone biosynthesis C-methylase UbiE
MTSEPWYVCFFGHDYFQLYEEMLPPERAVQEAVHIVDRLALPTGSAILDLCCGHGRHSIELAKLGYRVTGLDLSEVFLERARRDAEAAGVDVRWVQSDMRHIPFEAEFDAVINMFTAFAYLETKAEDQKVLDGVNRALKPGGVFLIENVLRESIMRRFMPYEVSRLAGDIVATHEREFDLRTSRLNDRVTLFHPGGARTEYYTSMRFYTLTELEEMLNAAGLVVDGYWGGLDGGELHLDSFRLVVRAHKPAVSG